MHVTPLLTVTPSVGGPELLEKSTVPNSAASHTHAATAAAATAATRRGGRGGQVPIVAWTLEIEILSIII